MSKAVLMSIQPKWCELIASGKKTIEVRKTRPKIETPFKCYIYQTKLKWFFNLLRKMGLSDLANKLFIAKGKIIGEFVCDSLIWVVAHPDIFAGHPLYYSQAIVDACLTRYEAEKYSGGKDVYGYHISDLIIYDEPKELSAFRRACPDNVYSCAMCRHGDFTGMKCTPIKRPPQSWCYVEEGENNE